MLIEQAIFTSAESSSGDGYRLVAKSAGVRADEAQELLTWGPSHDSLFEDGRTAMSVNFHPLASGRFCVGRSSHAGAEYSRRGGLRVYTQFLVLAADDLARFANNPFAVLRAATAQGRMQPFERIPPSLEPIRLAGKTPAVDQALLAETTNTLGLEAVLQCVDVLLSSDRLVLIANRDRQQLLAAVLNCLPVECRREFSFTTGLKPSPRRPFRILTSDQELPEFRRLGRDSKTLVHQVGDTRSTVQPTPWGRYLRAVLKGGTHTLATHLAIERTTLRLPQLQNLADSLLRQLESPERPAVFQPAPGEPRGVFPRLAKVGATDAAASRPGIDRLLAGQGASRTARPRIEPSKSDTRTRSSNTMIRAADNDWSAASQPASRTVEALELLDDTVFAALSGSETALDRLKQLWPTTLAKLGPSQLNESREHYIRRALATYRKCNSEPDKQDAARAQHAIEVVCALFGE
jgi:hypothetical protein